MTAISPSISVGASGVVPSGRMPLPITGLGYIGTGSANSTSKLIADPASLKRHCFRFADADNTGTFDTSSVPMCPPGVVQAAWIANDDTSDRLTTRPTGPQSVRFGNAVSNNTGWLILWSRG